jgi:DNA repair exonuclease SbcCD nuclease subunit
MKIVVICDTHFGVKNGSDIFLNYQQRFFNEVFFPYCVKNNIKKILHLGDFYDHRRYINFKVLQRTNEFLMSKLGEYGMHMDIIPGNHDVFFKGTNDLCSLNEVLGKYPEVISVHMKPTVVSYGSLDIALLPWINAENYADSIRFIESAPAAWLGSHLELSGFEMMKGAPATSHGMDASLFARYETVMSGHYHTKSQRDNIHYLGVAYEHTWADCNDPKYWHVIDTETRELLPVRNDLCIFKKLVYDDTPYDSPVEAVNRMDVSGVNGTFVKVIVAAKKDPFAFDKYLDRISAQEPFDLKIVENFAEYNSENVLDDEVNISDTSTLLNTYVDAVETELDKDRIKGKLQELYVEAQTADAL